MNLNNNKPQKPQDIGHNTPIICIAFWKGMCSSNTK